MLNGEYERRAIINFEEKILNRIDELLEKGRDLGELYLAVTNIFERIYGSHSPQLRLLESLRKQVYDDDDNRQFIKDMRFKDNLRGCLQELKSDIQQGRIVNIQLEARSEVLADFIVLAREALETGQKNIAAVVACAALEDALKRTARHRGLEVEGKVMSEVVNALKSIRAIRSAQGKVLDGYVRIRNDTFHARWEAVDEASINGIIAYTETLLIQQCSPLKAVDNADTS